MLLRRTAFFALLLSPCLGVQAALADTVAGALPVAAAGGAVAAPPSSVEGALMQFVPLFLIFAVFYFFLIRPQQKRFEQQKKTLEALRRGDAVITAGGVHGTVVKVDGEDVVVEIADGVRVKVVKSTISTVQAKTVPVAANNDATK